MFHAGSRILPLALALLCLPCFQSQPQAEPEKPKSAVLVSNKAVATSSACASSSRRA